MRTIPRTGLFLRRGAAAAIFASCAAAFAPGAPAQDAVPVRSEEAVPARSAERPAASGRVAGTVVLGPKLSSRKMRFHLYNDPVSASQPVAADEKRNVVVYLEPLGTAADAPLPARAKAAAAAAAERPRNQAPLAIRQEGLAFVPHVLPVVRGSTVEFPNDDPIFHNVFS